MITQDASDKIRQFNQRGLHYNLVADEVYKKRNSISDPFHPEYLPYIVAGLISFDMERMMGSPAESKYDTNMEGFAHNLSIKLEKIKPCIRHLMKLPIEALDIQFNKENIKTAYHILSAKGKDGLNRTGGGFYVGATKILHFLNPEAFIIIDSNASRAFKRIYSINLRSTTQPGYSSERYIYCMEHAKMDILNFGVKEFRSLEKGIPITRIYDKLTFMTGAKMLY